ncbi:MAG: SMC-Scp complex subunit ScpB [Nitrospirae bacterium]|nr:SMC-Scp complex subunit ScpB [Nitrospirota bacterium]MBI3594661.1 SMC-Scp complex subunit ScpB [Nitrospirota bacterium]
MEIHELKQIIESILFVATEPVPVEKIREVTGAEKKTVIQAVNDLISHFRSENHGLQVVEIAGGYQMLTLSENSPWVKKFLTVKTTGRLSKPGLETLAIIAYKQPIIRSEVESIRGVDSGGVIRTLLERRLVKIVGRKEMPGKPMLYGTTKEFLEYFGLNNLSGLPTLKEFKETVFPISEPVFIDTPPDAAIGNEPIVSQEGALSDVSPGGELELLLNEGN